MLDRSTHRQDADVHLTDWLLLTFAGSPVGRLFDAGWLFAAPGRQWKVSRQLREVSGFTTATEAIFEDWDLPPWRDALARFLGYEEASRTFSELAATARQRTSPPRVTSLRGRRRQR